MIREICCKFTKPKKFFRNFKRSKFIFLFPALFSFSLPHLCAKKMGANFSVKTRDLALYDDAKRIIEDARKRAIRSVDYNRVQMYWRLGKRIYEEEQQSKDRADYGAYLIRNLSKKLEPEFGSGFGVRQLEMCRQFFRIFPIAHTLRAQLNWSQYKLLIAIPDVDKRLYYECEAVNNAWTGRELKRQIDSMLYERLLMSNDKEAVLAVARKERVPEKPQEIFKEPMVLEFLGLEHRPQYYERDLETAIITHITDFLLELGKGFSFVARQKRILLEDDEFFVDLVFYNRLLRNFVVIEIKTGELTHQDLGQLQMYINYFDRYEKLPEENPTIGILLCSRKNDTVVRMTLPENCNTVMVSQYQFYLPTVEQFEKEVDEVIQFHREENE